MYDCQFAYGAGSLIRLVMNRCLPDLLNEGNSTANAASRNLTVAELEAQSYATRFYQSLSSSWQVIIMFVHYLLGNFES